MLWLFTVPLLSILIHLDWVIVRTICFNAVTFFNNIFTFRMHRAFHHRKYGGQCGDGLLKSLQDRADLENKNMKSMSVGEVLGVNEGDKNYYIAIATPLHQGILQSCHESCDQLFIDSTGSVDENNCRLFQVCFSFIFHWIQL